MFIKRSIDVLMSIALLTVLSPVMGIVSLMILMTMGSPILFRQVRPGFHERPFTVFKFRTMRSERNDAPASDQDRLTSVGMMLRRLSLDELPQFWNVLRGEMSLIGPRPLLCQYLNRYSPEQVRRHEVLPGITGWAQVNGRNAITWDEKFVLDVWYVDNWNLWLDLKILWLTLVKVFRREGISGAGHATMTEFTGSTLKES